MLCISEPLLLGPQSTILIGPMPAAPSGVLQWFGPYCFPSSLGCTFLRLKSHNGLDFTTVLGWGPMLTATLGHPIFEILVEAEWLCHSQAVRNQAGASLPSATSPHLTPPHYRDEGARKFFGVSFVRTVDLLMVAPPSWPDFPPITLELNVNTGILRGTQAFNF
jgi:hypothetical protein